MKQFKITKELVEKRDRRYKEAKNTIATLGYTPHLMLRARNDLFLYTVAYDCIKPKVWQMVVMDMFEKLSKDREAGITDKLGLLVVTPRQVGKSTLISILSKDFCWYHRNPTSEGKTMVGVFSNNDDNAKKLVDFNIKDRIYNSDRVIKKRTGGRLDKYLLSKTYQIGKQNKKGELRFKSFMGSDYNNDTITSLPPTNRGRGWTFSLLVMDEIAHLEDENFITNIAFPTVRSTNGLILGFTTPNGSSGYLYDIFDPNDDNDHHNFERFWVGTDAFETEQEKKYIAMLKQEAIATGRLASYMQEYEASFEMSQSKFFDPVAIDKHTLERTTPLPSSFGECVMGIDFGVTNSKSVISIIAPRGTYNKMDRMQYELVYQYEYGEDDTSILDDVIKLKEQYSVHNIIIDDCSQSHYFKIKAIQYGLPIQLVKFSTSTKQKMFGDLYRAFSDDEDGDCLYIYKEPELLKQLKAMLLKPTQTVDRIEKPRSGRDDRCDSLALSFYNVYNDVMHTEDSFMELI